MTTMRAVLVGTGNWAENHAAAYNQCRQVELVGICGHRNEGRLNDLADKYGIPERALDLPSLLAKTEPDILDIACNPHFRLAGVQAAIDAGSALKLINVEKPLALLPDDAYEIERLCRKHNKLLVVNHQKKFLPAWREAKDLITAGKIGPIAFMRGTCQGNLLEQGTHLLDMALFFNDYVPIRWLMGQIDELEGLDKAGASAPDAAVATLCFANDVRAQMSFGSIGYDIAAETNKWYQYALEIYGGLGHLKVTLNQTLEITTYETGTTVTKESRWEKHYLQALTQHLEATARYAQDPASGHVSDLAKSMASFEAIMAIYASGCGDGRVTLPHRFNNQLMTRLHQRRRGKE